jgi:hypothetical protein
MQMLHDSIVEMMIVWLEQNHTSVIKSDASGTQATKEIE